MTERGLGLKKMDERNGIHSSRTTRTGTWLALALLGFTWLAGCTTPDAATGGDQDTTAPARVNPEWKNQVLRAKLLDHAVTGGNLSMSFELEGQLAGCGYVLVIELARGAGVSPLISTDLSRKVCFASPVTTMFRSGGEAADASSPWNSVTLKYEHDSYGSQTMAIDLRPLGLPKNVS